jgi:hypothetical protein
VPVVEVHIALFPHEWSRDRKSPHLFATGYDDVPYKEPDQLRRCEYPDALRRMRSLRKQPPEAFVTAPARQLCGAAANNLINRTEVER